MLTPSGRRFHGVRDSGHPDWPYAAFVRDPERLTFTVLACFKSAEDAARHRDDYVRANRKSGSTQFNFPAPKPVGAPTNTARKPLRAPFVATERQRARVLAAIRDSLGVGERPTKRRIKERCPEIPWKHLSLIRQSLVKCGLVDPDDLGPSPGLTAKDEAEIRARLREEHERKLESIQCPAIREGYYRPRGRVCRRR